MGIKEDYRQAKVLASRGELARARSILLAYDHPKTNALLAQIDKKIQRDTKRDNRWSLLRFVVISIVLFAICYGMTYGVLWIYNKTQIVTTAALACAARNDVSCDTQYLIDTIPRELRECSDRTLTTVIICLESYGVEFE